MVFILRFNSREKAHEVLSPFGMSFTTKAYGIVFPTMTIGKFEINEATDSVTGETVLEIKPEQEIDGFEEAVKDYMNV